MTVEAWVKSDAGVWASNYGFVGKRNQFLLGGMANTPGVRFFIHTGSGWVYAQFYDIIDITKWHHYAGTYDGTTLRLYVDGVEVATNTAASIALDSGALAIGTDDMSNTPIVGNIQEVALYDKAITPARLLVHATSGLLDRDSCTSHKTVTDHWINPVVTFTPSMATLYINGSESCRINIADTGRDYTLGTGNRAWHGDIAEVMVFSEELTATQRLRIEAYQKNKWGTP